MSRKPGLMPVASYQTAALAYAQASDDARRIYQSYGMEE